MTATLVWAEALAAGPGTGAPVAVVLDAPGWDDRRLSAVAAALGASATVVVTPRDDGHAARAFAPAGEVALSGAALAGAALVLHAAGRAGPETVIRTGAGALATRVRGAVATVQMPVATAGAEPDPDEVADALGLAPADPPPRVWDAGRPQLMVAARDAAALAGARPDPAAIAALGARDGWLGVCAYAPARPAGDRLEAEARHFAPLLGRPGEVVSGTAAAALGARLAAARAGDAPLSLVVRQGGPGGRGGEVAVHVSAASDDPPRVQVGGRVTPTLEGRLLDP